METKMIYLMDNGHLTDEASALLIDALVHDRTPEVPEQVLTHIEMCGECKDKIIDVGAFLRNPDAARIRKRNRYFYPGKIAAVFVVFALLIGVYVVISQNPSFLNHDNTVTSTTLSQKQIITPKPLDSTKIEIDNKKPTAKQNSQPADAAFRMNPNLENMIDSQLRGIYLEALTPVNNTIVTIPIHFSWKKELAASHILEIVNNKNKILFSYMVSGTTFDFKENLAPGLYYWKIESKNELVHVGKFYRELRPQAPSN
jgi:hypothetical protein